MGKAKRVADRAVFVGNRKVVAHNVPQNLIHDLFHFALSARWHIFFGTIALVFLFLNAVFACLFCLGNAPIANQSPAGFWGAFFFSVETLATVGYGDMHPQSVYAHVVATIEIFVGMTCVALMTGVIFARFSRPRARIAFSRFPVIGTMNGKRMFMIRAANVRLNMIVDASAKLRMVKSETTIEGEPFRRIYDLELLRDEQPLFMLGWIMLHEITESSPLWGADAATLAEWDAGFVLTLNGHDDAIAQTVMVRQMYSHEMIRWNHRFVDLTSMDDEGNQHIDYRDFHETTPQLERAVD